MIVGLDQECKVLYGIWYSSEAASFGVTWEGRAFYPLGTAPLSRFRAEKPGHSDYKNKVAEPTHFPPLPLYAL